MDEYSQVRGKCCWWREVGNAEDSYDPNLKPGRRHVDCSCFVEGYRWSFPADELVSDCPRARECRYYIKAW